MMKDQRIVESIRQELDAGLQLFDRFKVGDTVAHITAGDGIVTGKTQDTVVVKFQKTMKDGTPLRGFYGVLWFNENPKFLFHRGTSPSPE